MKALPPSPHALIDLDVLSLKCPIAPPERRSCRKGLRHE
jgi:hypothetical protein